MAGITGQGTTFNLPNFVGELFGISPDDTPLLASIGGLTGGEKAIAKEFEWEFFDLRTPADRATRLEGAAAPTAESRVRANASNVLQIVHEAVEVSYTKLAARGQIDSASLVQGVNPVTNEFDWQLDKALKQIARDINYSFINGAYAKPADNLTPRKTRGLLAAIATNALTLDLIVDAGGDVTGVSATDIVTTASAHGMAKGDAFQFTVLNGGAGATVSTRYYVRSVPSTTTFTFSATRGGAKLDFTTAITTGSRISVYPAITLESLNDAMQMAYDNGGLLEGETRTLLVGTNQKRRVTKALITDSGYKETSRNVGGVNLSVVETDFGPLNIMMDRLMPADTIAAVSLEELAPVFLEVPDKGFLFAEPLAKVGSSNASQIYGEIGLKYGNERKHAKITGAG